jgi:carbonic anhydrase
MLDPLPRASNGATAALSYAEARPHSPADAVRTLLEGNARWAAGKSIHPGSDFARRECVASEGQKPFAALLSCADSRVPPELLFDQGVGDLFVVREAGNSVDKLGIQSLEYAVEHLGVQAILVLGHQNCGAVKGAVDSYPAPAPEFLALIYPAITHAAEIIRGRSNGEEKEEALRHEAVDQHVMVGVRQLRAINPFKEKIQLGQLKVIGGRYDLDNGRVTLLIE